MYQAVQFCWMWATVAALAADVYIHQGRARALSSCRFKGRGVGRSSIRMFRAGRAVGQWHALTGCVDSATGG